MNHVGDALELIYVAPWTVMHPARRVALSVLLVNLLGDGIRRAVCGGGICRYWISAISPLNLKPAKVG